MATTLDPIKIQDRHILTQLIKKELHEDVSLINQIAPLRSVDSRKIKIALREFTPAGKGQFKARNANTPIYRGGGTVIETLTSLVDLEEMEVIDPDSLTKLYSPDTTVAKSAQRGIAQIAKELAIRNRNLTRWMGWEAIKDNLTITFNDGTAFDVDYDLDNSDSAMSATHIVSASVDWSTEATADPVTDIQTWVDLIATDLGRDGANVMMNKKTFRTLQKVDQLEGFLLDHYGPLKIPNAEAMKTIFDLEGSILVDNGYWEDTDGTNTYYIPEGKVVVAAPFSVDNAPIAQIYDGPAVIWKNGKLVVANNPGMQIEIFGDPVSKATYVRLSTCRIPWIRREAFVYATVYTP